MASFRFHGNYVGPGWSAGRYQNSVADSDVPAVDEFDETAREHDRAYALKEDLKEADYRFYRKNIGKGMKRTIAALAVGAQGLFRKSASNSFSEKNKGPMAPLPKTPRKRVASGSYPTPKKTPKKVKYVPVQKKKGYTLMKEVVVKRTNRKRKAYAKSGNQGFFRKGKLGYGVLDRFARYGIITTRETGDVFSGSALVKYQSAGFHHASYGKEQLFTDISLALCKTIAQKIFRSSVAVVSAPLVAASGREVEVKMEYRTAPGASYSIQTWTLSPTTTVQSFATDFATWWKTQLAANVNMTFFVMTFAYKGVGTTPAVGNEVLGRLDMRRCKIQLYSKNSFKLQNRCISSVDNNEADDVDNVPLIGRSYDGSGNYFLTRDTYYSTAIANQNNIQISGYFSTDTELCSPPPISTLRRMTKVAKLHLDPGQVKTSVLVDSRVININSLNWIMGKSDATTNCMTIGKQRFLLFEKQIQSVATTDVSALKIAYEAELQTGVIVTIPNMIETTQLVTLSPL